MQAVGSENALIGRMQRLARIGGWEVDLITRAVTWTSETYRIHEVTPACYAPTIESTGDFYVAEHLPLIRNAMAQAMQFGIGFDLELEMITGRGKHLWVRAVGQVQRRQDRPRRLFGVIQDITERRRLEREILDIARYDQERIISGLHDDLGQALTGVSLMLRFLSKRASAATPSLSSEIEAIIALINRSIGTCASLAKGLAPVRPQFGGVSAALHSLAESYGQSRGIAVRVRQQGDLESSIEPSVADHLFRIAQSALMLVADHARSARISILIGARAGTLILSVAGDCPSPALVEESRARQDFGMLRRRAALIGATLQINPRRGGMRVRVSLRLDSRGLPRC